MLISFLYTKTKLFVPNRVGVIQVKSLSVCQDLEFLGKKIIFRNGEIDLEIELRGVGHLSISTRKINKDSNQRPTYC